MATVRRSSAAPPLPSHASVLEYARHHGICRAYETEDPLNPGQIPQAPIFLTQDLADPTGSLRIQPPQTPNVSERLDIDAAAAAELTSIAKLARDSQTAEQHPCPRRIKDFKVEPPILGSDHELDAIKFRKRDCFRLQDVTVPFEHTDDEQDEGLSWPAWCREISSRFDSEVASDKLAIPKEAMLYLHAVCVRPQKPETPEPLPTRRKTVQPVTPPLLPADPLFPQVPGPSSSSPTGQVELLSEATNSTAAEAEALERKIFQEDRICTPEAPGLRQFTEDPMLFDDIEDIEMEEYQPPTMSRRNAAELKVETPLTPPSTLPSAFRSSTNGTKSVSFPDDMLEYIPTELPSHYENGNAVLDSENDFNAFFEEQLAPIAEKVDRQVEREQLQEVGTTKRVEVPNIVFEPPRAPWEEYGLKPSLRIRGISTELDAQKRLISRCTLENLAVAPKWQETMKQEMGMPWDPFPKNFAQAPLTESIQHDAALNETIGSSSLKEVDIIGGSSLAWKLEGLRILDDAEDVEEISVWKFEPGNDMASLLQKRRLELADEDDRTIKQLVVPTPVAVAASAPEKKQRLEKIGEGYRTVNGNKSFMFGGLFATSGSLAQFMHVQTGKALPEEAFVAEEPEHTSKDDHMQDSTADQDEEAEHGTLATTPLPTPPIPNDLPPKPFIISTTLLMCRRGLVRHIQTLYPAAQLIERDPNRPLSTHTPATAATSPSEPDIMLSPSTGLLLTTLQRLKQRPLPGQQQTTENNFQTQIAQISRKFAHLLILVGEITTHPLDPGDCAALATLHGFVASLHSSVTVSYIPGGELDLARWIVAAMAAYGRTAEELLLLLPPRNGGEGEGATVLQEEEGLWELFLRRVGMNAFAAQVVLARLKERKEPQIGGYGLVEFVRMGSEERRTAFEKVLGGEEGVLGVVGERVDGVWATTRVR